MEGIPPYGVRLLIFMVLSNLKHSMIQIQQVPAAISALYSYASSNLFLHLSQNEVRNPNALLDVNNVGLQSGLSNNCK